MVEFKTPYATVYGSGRAQNWSENNLHVAPEDSWVERQTWYACKRPKTSAQPPKRVGGRHPSNLRR